MKSVSACLEHACRSKQIKGILHGLHNFQGHSLGKIFSCHSVVSRWFFFCHPKLLCDMTHYRFAGTENPSEGGSGSQAPAEVRRSPNTLLFFVRVIQHHLRTLPGLCCGTSLPTSSGVGNSPKSAQSKPCPGFPAQGQTCVSCSVQGNVRGFSLHLMSHCCNNSIFTVF